MALFQKKRTMNLETDSTTPILNTNRKHDPSVGRESIAEPQEPKRLTLQQQIISERFQEFADLRVYGASDVAAMPASAVEAEKLNLLVAIYAELKSLREAVERQLE